MRLESINSVILNEISKQIVISEDVRSLPTKLISRQIMAENIDLYFDKNVGFTLSQARDSGLSMNEVNMTLLFSRLFCEGSRAEIEKIVEFNRQHGIDPSDMIREILKNENINKTDRELLERVIERENLNEGMVMDLIIGVGSALPGIGIAVAVAGVSYYLYQMATGPDDDRMMNGISAIFSLFTAIPGIGAALSAAGKNIFLPILKLGKTLRAAGGSAKAASQMGTVERALMNLVNSTKGSKIIMGTWKRIKGFSTTVNRFISETLPRVLMAVPMLGPLASRILTLLSSLWMKFISTMDDTFKLIGKAGDDAAAAAAKSGDEVAAGARSATAGRAGSPEMIARATGAVAPAARGFYGQILTKLSNILDFRLAKAFVDDAANVVSSLRGNVYRVRHGDTMLSVTVSGVDDGGKLVLKSATQPGRAAPIGVSDYASLTRLGPGGGQVNAMQDIVSSGKLTPDGATAVAQLQAGFGRAGLYGAGVVNMLRGDCLIHQGEATVNVITGEIEDEGCFGVATLMAPSEEEMAAMAAEGPQGVAPGIPSEDPLAQAQPQAPARTARVRRPDELAERYLRGELSLTGLIHRNTR